MQSPPRRERKYLGMTGAEIAVLCAMGLAILCLLGVGGWIVLGMSRPSNLLAVAQNTALPAQPAQTNTPTAPSSTPTNTPLPTRKPTPSDTPFPTFTPGPTPTLNPCLNSAYVADVTMPDGTRFNSDKFFLKTWRVKNNGKCDWEKGTFIAFYSGEKMTMSDTEAVNNLRVGEYTEISLRMWSPSQPGTYRAVWRMKDSHGNAFGEPLRVVIVVDNTIRPTPLPTVNLPSPTPIPTYAPLPTITPRPALTPDKAFLSALVNCTSSKASKEMTEAFNSFETYYRNGTLCSKWIVNAEPAIVSASKCLYDLPEPADRDLVVAWKDLTSAAIFEVGSIKSFKNYCNTGSQNSLKSASEAAQTGLALVKDANVYMQRYIDAHP